MSNHEDAQSANNTNDPIAQFFESEQSDAYLKEFLEAGRKQEEKRTAENAKLVDDVRARLGDHAADQIGGILNRMSESDLRRVSTKAMIVDSLWHLGGGTRAMQKYAEMRGKTLGAEEEEAITFGFALGVHTAIEAINQLGGF